MHPDQQSPLNEGNQSPISIIRRKDINTVIPTGMNTMGTATQVVSRDQSKEK